MSVFFQPTAIDFTIICSLQFVVWQVRFYCRLQSILTQSGTCKSVNQIITITMCLSCLGSRCLCRLALIMIKIITICRLQDSYRQCLLLCFVVIRRLWKFKFYRRSQPMLTKFALWKLFQIWRDSSLFVSYKMIPIVRREDKSLIPERFLIKYGTGKYPVSLIIRYH